jgi:hypothetical protein
MRQATTFRLIVPGFAMNAPRFRAERAANSRGMCRDERGFCRDEEISRRDLDEIVVRLAR